MNKKNWLNIITLIVCLIYLANIFLGFISDPRLRMALLVVALLLFLLRRRDFAELFQNLKNK